MPRSMGKYLTKTSFSKLQLTPHAVKYVQARNANIIIFFVFLCFKSFHFYTEVKHLSSHESFSL